MRARTRGHVRGGRCVLASNEGHRGNFESASMGGSVGLSGAVWGGVGWDGVSGTILPTERTNAWKIPLALLGFLPLLPSIDASSAEAFGEYSDAFAAVRK